MSRVLVKWPAMVACQLVGYWIVGVRESPTEGPGGVRQPKRPTEVRRWIMRSCKRPDQSPWANRAKWQTSRSRWWKSRGDPSRKSGSPRTGGPSGLSVGQVATVCKGAPRHKHQVLSSSPREVDVFATSSGSLIVSGGVRKRESACTVVTQNTNEPAPPRYVRGTWGCEGRGCNPSNESQICAGRRVVVRVKGSLRSSEVLVVLVATWSTGTMRAVPAPEATQRFGPRSARPPVSARRSRRDLAWRPGHNPTRVLPGASGESSVFL